MYEMYPEVWVVADPQQGAATPPRRRPRKEHSVLPAVIARQVRPPEPRGASLG